MAHYLKKRSRNDLILGVSKDLSFLLWIAKEKGFLSDEKLNLHFKTVPYTRKGMENLIEDKIDCAVLVETNIA